VRHFQAGSSTDGSLTGHTVPGIAVHWELERRQPWYLTREGKSLGPAQQQAVQTSKISHTHLKHILVHSCTSSILLLSLKLFKNTHTFCS